MKSHQLAPQIDTALVHQLNVQTHQIRTVLQANNLSAEVSGGRVSPGSINYELQTHISNGLEKLQGVLMWALGVRDISITRDDGQWQIHVERAVDAAVPLPRLLEGVAALPPATLLLGLTGDGAPMTANLADEAHSHALISGRDGAGKTSLLRAIAAGLAFTNRQADLQLLVVDGHEPTTGRLATRESLRPLGYLPHMLTDPVAGAAGGSEVLRFLAYEMDHRRKNRVAQPTVVALIDHVVGLLEAGSPDLPEIMLRLLQHGAAAGIHLILATERPGAATLDAMFRSLLPLRLVGRTNDATESRDASGIEDSYAEYLLGAGDFVAVTDSATTRFQAAYIGDYDLHHQLDRLYATARPRLLARPMDVRPQLARPADSPAEVQTFTVKDGEVSVRPEVADDPLPFLVEE